MFTNILLADEINRTPPKTQSALLEAMEERQVSVDGVSRHAARPVHRRGDAEPDRVRGHLHAARGAARPVPAQAHARRAGARHRGRGAAAPRRRLQPARPGRGRRDAGARAPPSSQRPAPSAASVGANADVLAYIVDLARATRRSPSVKLGVSPRGTTALLAAAKAWAWLSGYDSITPDHVQAMLRPGLAPPHPAAPGGRARGRRRRRDPALDRAAGPGSDLGADVTVSGRFVALLALGVVPVVLLGAHEAAGLRRARPAGSCCACVLGVGRPRSSPRRPARWRSSAASRRACAWAPRRRSELLRDEHRARGRCAARSATPGSRRPEREPTRTPRRHPRRRAPSAGRIAAPVAARRAPRRTASPCARGGRCTSWARQATLEAPGRIRVLPPFTSRKHLPSRLARLRELDGQHQRHAARPGHRVRLPARVRARRRRALDRLAGDGAAARPVGRTRRPRHGAHLAPRARPPRGHRDRLGRTSAARIADEPRIDTAFESALLLAALATRAGDRVDLIAYDRVVRGRVQGASGPELLSRMVDAMAGIEPGADRDGLVGRPGAGGLGHLASARSSCCSPRSTRRARSRGLLSVLPQLTREAPRGRGVRHRSRTPCEATQRAPRTASGVPRRRRRALAARRRRVAAAVRRLGADVVTGSPADLPPALADRYLALKAAGRL